MEEGMPPEKKGMLSKSIPFGNDSVGLYYFFRKSRQNFRASLPGKPFAWTSAAYFS
jgi:hypothetical protein